MANMQTRAISGQIEVLNFLPPYEKMTDDALDCAKRNLRINFKCAGVIERFDESLLIMKRKLGWRKIYEASGLSRVRRALRRGLEAVR